VAVEDVSPRPIAAVKVRLPIDLVPSQFAQYLNQVYEASRNGMVSLDGQNIFVYRGTDARDVEIDFGVGATKPFAAVGAVTYTHTPGGKVATTTHWGDYRALGHAHDAVVSWCHAHGHQLAGPRWEVYGHMNPDARQRTDIYYLLSEP
jgi:effector-binding domain-containing protein